MHYPVLRIIDTCALRVKLQYATGRLYGARDLMEEVTLTQMLPH